MSGHCEKHNWDEGPKDAPCPDCYRETPYKDNPFLAFLKENRETAIRTNHNDINSVVYEENPAKALLKEKK